MRFNRRSDAVYVTACLLAVPALAWVGCASSADEAVHRMPPSGTVQPEDVPSPIAREPALAQVAVDMLRAHDRSVESLSWRQVIEAAPSGRHVPAPTAPAAIAARVPEDRALGFRASSTEPPAATRTRVAALWSEVDVDRRNRSIMRSRQRLVKSWTQAEDGSLSPVTMKPEVWETYSDGAVQTRIDRSDTGEAVLARLSKETSELGAWPSPLRAVGRGFVSAGLRLADVLQMAPDLHVVQDVERDGERLVTLRGTVPAGELWRVCTVQVNISRDGRPESIDVHDPFTGALSRRVVVEEYREIEGIWIPVRAMFGGYDLAKGPAGEPVDQQFISMTFGALEPLLRSSLNVAEGERIPTDLSDPSVRAAWARAVHQTVGPEGPYCRPLVLHWMNVDEVVALNDSDLIEARIDAWRLPDDVRVVDVDAQGHFVGLAATP